MIATDQVLLCMRGIGRSFPGVRALDGVDFTVRRGEVHALMGENGAGKSTLIKVLTGVCACDAGEILLDGQRIAPRSPRDAEACGISTVYQEVNLIPHLSVAENICLGRQPTRFGALRWRALRERARAALARVDLDLDVDEQLSACSVAVQQMVAIARALDVSAKLLILDEPTSSLDEREVAELFGVIRKLRAEGLGIVFVTHFLDQVYAISDRITVLRNGRLVGEYRADGLPRLELITRMIGRELEASSTSGRAVGAAEARAEPPWVRVSGLGRRGSIASFDLDIHAGEVVGMAGLLGSGRTETARLMFGIDLPDSGSVTVAGQNHRIRSPAQAVALGFAFTPEDRKVAGIVPNLSVRENIVLALQASRGAWRQLPCRQQEDLATRFIGALGIKVSGPEQPVGTLSGGNQQKVLLARWLATEPRLLLLDEPTRGIDVGAKAEIEKLLRSFKDRGMAVLFISSELEELVRASDRVAVLRDRAKIGELTGEAITEHEIMRLIAQAPAGKEGA